MLITPAPQATPTSYPPVTLTVRRPVTMTPPFVQPQQGVPTPTATLPPPPTPTPQVYVVQAGDTLLGIAITFGIELATLQAANPGVDALSLQIGQTLLIPAGGAPIPDSPLAPTSMPLALQVVPPTCTRTPLAGLLCLGVVVNPLGVPVERVGLRVTLARADGTRETQDVAVEQALILPGTFAPYRALFPPDAARGDFSAGADLLSADDASAVLNRFAPVQVTDAQGTVMGERYVVTARITLPEGAAGVRYVVTVRDDGGAGRVLGYRVVLDTGMAAGETRAVRVELALTGDPARAAFTLVVEARR